MKKMSLEQAKDAMIGIIGTPERDAYEARLNKLRNSLENERATYSKKGDDE